MDQSKQDKETLALTLVTIKNAIEALPYRVTVHDVGVSQVLERDGSDLATVRVEVTVSDLAALLYGSSIGLEFKVSRSELAKLSGLEQMRLIAEAAAAVFRAKYGSLLVAASTRQLRPSEGQRVVNCTLESPTRHGCAVCGRALGIGQRRACAIVDGETGEVIESFANSGDGEEGEAS